MPLNRDAWEPIVADLAEIQPVLALFDPLMVSKVMLRHIFRRRYGTDGICDDIAGFSDFFQDSFYRPFADTGIVARSNAFSGSALNYLQVPEVTEILNARTGLASYLESVLAGSGIREIELPQALVSELRAVGLAQQPLLSNSFFIQLFGRGASAGAVLNDVQRGVGSMMTRFQHVFSEADRNMSIDTLRSNISLLENDETVVAQFQGGYFTNLNAHSLMTRFEIVMPGERSSAPPERLLHLHELSLRYDSSRRQVNLFCERIAKYVVPIYTGMLFPLALPELQILLLHLGTPVRLDTDLFSTSERAAGEVAYRPRLRYGRIILQRERWLVDIETLPARDVSETDYAYFSRLVTWQRGCRIPVRCFAQIRTASAQKAPPRSDALLPRKDATPVQRDKPFLVDFDNPFLLLGLERSVAGRGGAIAFTEMLPADDDLSLLYNGKPHISEFVLDITCKGAL